MSKSYTPGLIVLENTKIRKKRQLPMKGKVLVEIGDKVSTRDVVASTEIPGNVQMMNAANQLNIEPENIKDYMLLDIDQSVKRGDVIAENKGLFGLFKTSLKSPIDGTVANISDVTGQIIISEPPIPIEVNSYIGGKVVEVIEDEGAVVEVEGAHIQGILGIGGETQGEILILSDDRELPISEEMLNESHKNKILIGGSYISVDAYKKAQSIGVSGIVVGGFDYDALSNLLGYQLGVAITGSEEIGTSIVMTEGFGQVSMANRTFELFKKFNNQVASMNGSTQIRAGVIRPEVVIPQLNGKSDIKNLSENDMIISEGSSVRVIRTPYFGKVGKVISLPSELMKMESETIVRVAEVKFSDGEKALMPRANLEMILD